MMKYRLILLLGVLQLAALPAASQTTRLSVATIFGSGEFESDLTPITWSDDPAHFTTLRQDGNTTDLYRVNARSGVSDLLLRGSDLVPPGQTAPIQIESYEFSADRSKLLIFTNSVRVWRQNTKGEFYIWDFDRRRLTPVSSNPGLQQFAKFSPDGRRVGFVRDNNIFVSDTRSGREEQLTFDGDENIINGTTDWVYEEELGLRDAFRFSPDSKRIAFWRLDQTAIQPFYMIDNLSLYPELVPVRYPKAGAANSEVRIGVVEISSGRTTWIDLGVEPDIYVARMDFADSSDEIWLTRLNRHQNRLDLMLADVKNGESRVVMTDTDEAWVDNNEPYWIDGGRQFLFESERDGYNQVYLFNRDGTLAGKVTRGEWDVSRVHGVDEIRRILYFSGAGEGPLKNSLYQVGLDGEEVTRISSASGSHTVQFNSDYSLYLDVYSTAGVPPARTLHTSDGGMVRMVSDNRELLQKIQALAVEVPEFISIPVGNGVVLNGYIVRPPDFDVSKTYPLLMYVYGGPGSQTVRDSWGGTRYLWHQMLAQEGHLVVSVDNRGTGGRGRDFKKITYENLGRYEAADQIAAAQYMGSLPFVDAGRIGIWGWSYGGYMALMATLTGPSVFKAAISVAPVTDWRLYDTIYTERYMRTPEENPRGYEYGAPLSHVDSLQGNLLIVHGTADDNVHAQNTIQLIQKLEEAGKQFDMRIYPNKTHSIAGAATRVNLYTLFTEWLKEHL
ncbi:MAG: S9 family peptidase [Gemmatimonadota bacterium]|nr:MAG: S9 family peptidase [Gemmatimonadota bacterium]